MEISKDYSMKIYSVKVIAKDYSRLIYSNMEISKDYSMKIYSVKVIAKDFARTIYLIITTGSIRIRMSPIPYTCRSAMCYTVMVSALPSLQYSYTHIHHYTLTTLYTVWYTVYCTRRIAQLV